MATRPLLLIAGAVSGTALALGAAKLALPAALALGGATAGAVAAVNVAVTLAWPLFGLFAGLLLDRYRRVGVLLAGELLALMALLAALLLAGFGQVEVVAFCLVGFTVGLSEVLAETAGQTLVPEIVPPENYGRANGLVQGGKMVALTLLGPIVGTALLGLSPSAGFAAATVALLLAVVATTLVRPLARPTGPRAPRSLAGVLEGVRYLRREPTLAALTILLAGMIACWSAWTTLIIPYAVSAQGLGLPAEGLTLILASLGLGSLLGAPLVGWVRRRLGDRWALFLDPAGTVLFLAAPALGLGTTAICLATAAAGFGGVVWLVTVASLQQASVPADRLGRVVSAYRWIGWMTLPLGALLAGVVVEATSFAVAFGAFALLALAFAAAFFLLLPAQRPLPTAVEHGAELR